MIANNIETMQLKQRDLDFSKTDAEMASAIQESIDLDREGRFDDAAAARLDARLREISARLDKKIEAEIGEFKRGIEMSQGRQKPTWPGIIVFISILLAIVGALLELAIGKGFIFSASNSYRNQYPPLLLASALLCGAGLFLVQVKTQFMNDKAPTWFVRWLLLFPLLVLLCAASIIVSPLGWAALAGYVVGTPYKHIEVRVLSVDEIRPGSRKGCGQYATIDYRDNSARICLDGRIAGQLVAGEKALVAGRQSVFGLFIDEIKR